MDLRMNHIFQSIYCLYYIKIIVLTANIHTHSIFGLELVLKNISAYLFLFTVL